MIYFNAIAAQHRGLLSWKRGCLEICIALVNFIPKKNKTKESEAKQNQKHKNRMQNKKKLNGPRDCFDDVCN